MEDFTFIKAEAIEAEVEMESEVETEVDIEAVTFVTSRGAGRPGAYAFEASLLAYSELLHELGVGRGFARRN